MFEGATGRKAGVSHPQTGPLNYDDPILTPQFGAGIALPDANEIHLQSLSEARGHQFQLF